MKLARLTLIAAFTLVGASAQAQPPMSRLILLGGHAATSRGEVEKLGGKEVRELRYFPGNVVELPTQAIAALSRRLGSGVSVIEDRRSDDALLGKPRGDQQPPESTPWGVAKTKAPEAWSSSRGAGVAVCVVDSGIDASHRDLSTNIIGGENFVANRKGAIDPNAWGTDENGHGTHVAGTIAALDNDIGVVGVAPEASLLVMKVANARGQIYDSDFAEGVMSCIEHGAQVINMSVAVYSTDLAEQAFQLAEARGVVLVAAAGNSNYFTWPAQDPRTVAVTAIQEDLSFWPYSSRARDIDVDHTVTAPGAGVLSTAPGGGYQTMDGTSMAAPHVAGVFALMFAAGKTTLMTTDLGLPANEQGRGLVNAYDSVTAPAQ